MFALIFVLLTLAHARVTIIDSTCETALCQNYLQLYVQRLNSEVSVKQIDKRFVTTVSHQPVAPGTAGLYAIGYTETTTKITAADFTKTTDSNGVYLHLALSTTEVQDTSKCKQVSNTDSHIIRQCKFLIEYYGAVQDMVVKQYKYSMTVQIPRTSAFSFIVIGNPILEIAKDLQIITNAVYTTKMYSGSGCTNEIQAGHSLIYGDDVCFSIIGGDTFTREFEFEVVAFTATYSRTGKADVTIDMKPVSIYKRALNNVYTKGQMFIIAPIMNIGRLNFACIIKLNEVRRVLQFAGAGNDELPKAFQPSMPGEHDVTDPNGLFVDEEVVIDLPKSSASWFLLPLLAFAATLALLI
jgi:hypothetical protein